MKTFFLQRKFTLFFIILLGIGSFVWQRTPNPITEAYPFGEANFGIKIPGDFSFIILPDTQYYSQKHPEILMSQMNWIKDFHQELNTQAVITLGDIVQSRDDREEEWQNATKAYDILDNTNLPYNVLPGNHDISESGATKLFNRYFPPERFDQKPWYGGNHDGTNRNNFITFDVEGIDFVVVSLEYCPPDNATLWAREVFERHSDKIGVLATHAYLNAVGVRSEECKRSTRRGDNSGMNIWEKVVKPSKNVQIVMNGHFHAKQGGTYLTTEVDDRTVHQIMSNYQDFENGGNGFLRIMSFFIEGETVRVKAYSPFTESFLTDSVNNFEFEIDGLSL